jgi:hypothetical protein
MIAELYQDDEGIVINGVRFCPGVFDFFADAAKAGTLFRFHSNHNGSVTIEIISLPGSPSSPPN